MLSNSPLTYFHDEPGTSFFYLFFPTFYLVKQGTQKREEVIEKLNSDIFSLTSQICQQEESANQIETKKFHLENDKGSIIRRFEKTEKKQKSELNGLLEILNIRKRAFEQQAFHTRRETALLEQKATELKILGEKIDQIKGEIKRKMEEDEGKNKEISELQKRLLEIKNDVRLL